MQLIDIDKAIYRRHLNIVIGSFVALLLVLSLVFAQIMILFFSEPINIPTETVNNFKFNFLGVFLSLLTCGAILHNVKRSAFFKEVYYVWRVKQIHNSIYRKLRKVKAAAKNNEETAFIILWFYYQSQKQIYLLDDNTLTLSSLEKNIVILKETIAKNNFDISSTKFDKSLLASYA